MSENINKIKKLLNDSKSIGSFWDSFTDVTSDPNCDKYKANFNGDSRFTVFSCNVYFSAHTGYYGNSSCSTYRNNIGRDLAPIYFIKAIETLKESIFKEMSDAMKLDALALKGEAEKEVTQLQELIDSIGE